MKSLWQLVPAILICLMGMAPMSLAQEQTPNRATVSIIATNLAPQANPLDGTKPIGSFEIHNNTNKPVMISGGYITVSIQAGVKGELWVQTSLKDKALHSNHLVYTYRGAYAFSPPAPLLVIPPGKMSELHVFLKAVGPLIPSRTANAVTLETLHYCSQIEITQVAGGTVDVVMPTPLKYNFEIRPKKVAKEQKGDRIIAAKFVFDNRHKLQNLLNVNFRLNGSEKMKGEAELWVDGTKSHSTSIQKELNFKRLKLLMVKGVHDIELVLKTNLKDGDKVQATLTNVETKSGSLPVDMAAPTITIK